jgi:mRNA-degrading endonuclease RelE of RelBE toxin-antitoxin system
MPNDDPAPGVVIRYTPEFKRNLRALSRKYRHIRSDVQPIIERIQERNFVGDQIAGTGRTVFKVRVRNSDLGKGKSAGYRLIYLLNAPTDVVLITIYFKSEQSDISAAQIRRIVSDTQSRP